MVNYQQFLTTESFEGFEDPEKFNSIYADKIEQYKKELAQGILPQNTIDLPDSIDNLVTQQFNAVKYLYDSKPLTPRQFEITDTPAHKLAEKIANKEYSSVEVFNAFARRATIAHQFTNGAMDLFPEVGLKRAQELDDYLAKNDKTVGPLHGVPVSLKEQMDFKDRRRHASFVSQIDHICEAHGSSAHILGKLGAVFYIRTSQPQSIMHLDSRNNITGYTRNPFNLSLSPGGSSSGEGAIVGLGGSAMGTGSDIGGSIRAPAAFSGIHGLRPTTKRVGLFGGFSAGAGQESVLPVAGPMTRSVDDIEFWMRHYINDGKPWEFDQNCLRLPWRDVPKPNPKDITIAVMFDDGIVKPTPPMARGLRETVAKLKEAGVKIIEFEPIETKLAFETVNQMYTCDGNYMQRKLLSESGEPLMKLTKWFLNFGKGSKEFTVAENRKLNFTRDNLRNLYNRYFIDNKVDFILSPSYNNVAPQPDEIYNWSYTALYNILDLPTLTFQTGLFQDPQIDKWGDDHKHYKFRSDLEKLELDNYKPENFVGAPIGLQLSGRRYFDEEVVAAGRTIIDILGTDLYKLYSK